MADIHYANVIVESSVEINRLLSLFVMGGYKHLSELLTKPLGSLITLYFILVGYGILRGLTDKPFKELANGAVRIGIIYMLAMNWSFFSSYFIDFFDKAVSDLSQKMMDASPVSLPNFGGTGVNANLQAVLTEVIRIGSWIWNDAGYTNIGPYFTALFVYISGISVVGLTFFEIIQAKILMSVAFVSAPLFIMFTLFDKTRDYFDRWLGVLVSSAFTVFLVSIVSGLCMHIIHWTVVDHYLEKAAHFTSVGWIPLVLMSVLCVITILEVVGLAKHIGGACSSRTGSSMVGGFMGAAAGAASAKGATRAMTSGIMKTASKFTPTGAIASSVQSAVSQMTSKRGQGMKAIQQGIRGGNNNAGSTPKRNFSGNQGQSGQNHAQGGNK